MSYEPGQRPGCRGGSSAPGPHQCSLIGALRIARTDVPGLGRWPWWWAHFATGLFPVARHTANSRLVAHGRWVRFEIQPLDFKSGWASRVRAYCSRNSGQPCSMASPVAAPSVRWPGVCQRKPAPAPPFPCAPDCVPFQNCAFHGYTAWKHPAPELRFRCYRPRYRPLLHTLKTARLGCNHGL